MKLEDHLFISRGDVALSVTVEAYYSGDHSDNRPAQKEYDEWTTDVADALNDVTDALEELDELPPTDELEAQAEAEGKEVERDG